MSWQLRISEPSGASRIVSLKGSAVIGRGEPSEIILKDPTIPMEAATLWPTGSLGSSPFWIKISNHNPPAYLGDLAIREAHLPKDTPIRLGETQLILEQRLDQNPIPSFPMGVKPWLTCSEAGRKVLWITKKAACTPLSLYIAGETGTGKEVLAHLIHAWSDRRAGPFVPLHCGALPLSLAESELFGHVKGAFTGAIHQRPGALLQAHNGTLFLDEVGDLPLDIQVKLLRFLENGEIRQVGADHMSRADVRLICATHLPLEKLVEEGKFRSDLYYRLASLTIEIPPLRERPNDIQMLALKFASELDKSLSPRAYLRLQAHCWPGNVRELRHAIERASGLSGEFSPVLGEDAFDFLLTPQNVRQAPELELGASALTLKEMERIMLLKALRLSNGNRAKSARILGVARSTLFEMLKRHKIMGPKQASEFH